MLPSLSCWYSDRGLSPRVHAHVRRTSSTGAAVSGFSVFQASWPPSGEHGRSAKLIMTLSKESLLGVLRIAHASSMRGERISLCEALMRCDYRRVRQEFGPKDLVPLLEESHELIGQWLAYCEDKRTSGGYWVSKDTCEVGSLESPLSTVKCNSAVEAVAQFVVSELDYWLAVGDRRTRS